MGEAARSTSSSPSVVAGSRGTLLIVEDHAINQEVARGIVAKLGYRSDVAGDGIEALAALERRRYDAVLMDCHMPEMDGFAATTEIRRREAGVSHVPIIAMTAGALVEDREKCIAAGDYLAKPVKERDLEVVLARWLGNGPGSPAPEQGPGRVEGNGVLDAAQFDSVREVASTSDDPGFLLSLVDNYVAEAASQLAALRDAAARGDRETFEQLAHGLKGTSATMGASGVATACEALEDTVAHGELPGPHALEQLADEVQRATAALRRQAPPSP